MAINQPPSEFTADNPALPPVGAEPPAPPVSLSLGRDGGELTAADGRLTLAVPPDAFGEAVRLEVQSLPPSIATGHVMLARWRVVANPDPLGGGPTAGPLPPGVPQSTVQPQRPITL